MTSNANVHVGGGQRLAEFQALHQHQLLKSPHQHSELDCPLSYVQLASLVSLRALSLVSSSGVRVQALAQLQVRLTTRLERRCPLDNAFRVCPAAQHLAGEQQVMTQKA